MTSKKQVIIISALVLILVIGCGGVGYWYYQKNRAQKPVITGNQPHPEAKFTKLTEKDLSADDFKIYQAALETLSKQPGDKGALINLGYIFKKTGNLEDARLAFTILGTWDQIEPDPEGNLGLARVLRDQKNYSEAEKTYYQILKIFPLYGIAYKELLDMYELKLVPINPVFIEYINHAKEFDKTGGYTQDLTNFMLRYNELKNRQ